MKYFILASSFNFANVGFDCRSSLPGYLFQGILHEPQKTITYRVSTCAKQMGRCSHHCLFSHLHESIASTYAVLVVMTQRAGAREQESERVKERECEREREIAKDWERASERTYRRSFVDTWERKRERTYRRQLSSMLRKRECKNPSPDVCWQLLPAACLRNCEAVDQKTTTSCLSACAEHTGRCSRHCRFARSRSTSRQLPSMLSWVWRHRE